MSDDMTLEIPVDKPAIYFTDGSGTLFQLDWEVPAGGRLSLSQRQQALALALLKFARWNVKQAADDAAWDLAQVPR